MTKNINYSAQTQIAKDCQEKIVCKPSESRILRECLELLALRGLFAYRNNTGATEINGRYIRYGLKGSGDIISILPSIKRNGIMDHGVFLAIECKTPLGRQSKAQKVFQKIVENNGGIYMLVRDSDELAASLDALLIA